MADTGKRISTKQDKIELLERKNRNLLEELTKLQDARESQYLGSKTYSAMKRDLSYQQAIANSMCSDYTYWKKRLSEATQFIRQLKKDNEQLLKGETRYSLGLRYDKQLEQMDEKIRKLQAEIDGKDAMIKFIRLSVMEYLYAEAEEKPEIEAPASGVNIKAKGRPASITELEKREIRKLRREGYSIREISEISRVSVGYVQKIVQRIKVDPEVAKEHRREQRTKK